MTAPAVRVDRLALPSEAPAAPERPIMGALQVVWRGRWIMAICLILASVAGLIRAHNALPMYQAKCKLFLQQSVPSFLGEGFAGNAQTGINLSTQIEILHSSIVLKQAMQQPGVAEAACLAGNPNPVGYLKTAVLAGAGDQSDLITIEMDSADPKDAATIVNGVVAAYINYLTDQHQSSAVDQLKMLQARVNDQKSELEKQQQKLTDFKKQYFDVAINGGKGRAINVPYAAERDEAHRQRNELKWDLEEARQYRDDPEGLFRIIQQANSIVGLPPYTEPIVNPDLRVKVSALEQELADLPEQNPATLTKQKVLATLRREVALQRTESAQKIMALLEREYQSALQRETNVNNAFEEARTKVLDVTSKEAEYDQLVSQIESTNRDLDMLYGRMKTISPNEKAGGLTASVLEPAVPNVEAPGKTKSYLLGMALVVGLMAGLGGSVLLEMVDQRFRSVEEVGRTLALPILGTVPRISSNRGWVMPTSLKDAHQVWRNYLKVPVELIGKKQLKQSQNMMECGQVMHLQPRCDAAESYRSIRTAIYFGLSGHPAKTILITSPSSGDGKTTLASNLAIAIAQAGRRVLLIDADCWRPAQHDIFGLSEDVGLTSVLLKKATLAQAVRKTDVANLDVLPCGELPSNPAELLESQGLLDLFAEAGEEYDQILIDSPPVVPITDARILAASCGATILVLRANKSTRGQADAAFEALSAVGAPILGVVVNDVLRPAHRKTYQNYRFSAESRKHRWNNYQTSGVQNHSSTSSNGNGSANGNGSGNGNGHTKQLTGPIVEADEVIEHQRS